MVEIYYDENEYFTEEQKMAFENLDLSKPQSIEHFHEVIDLAYKNSEQIKERLVPKNLISEIQDLENEISFMQDFSVFLEKNNETIF
ncbi:MAG: hypothetical protein HRT47_05960 [Candidatus Caenarcaniphilales bacterium]|nr:hypothetical protein [Candidatus Caenarcaniphilales bacterium]